MSRHKAVSIVMVMFSFTIIQKFGGFIREILLGYKYGTSFEADAYVIAITVPTILFSSILAAISTTFIPIYSKIKVTKNNKLLNKFTNNILSIVLVISVIFVVLGLLNADFIVNILGMGLNEKSLELAVELTRYCIFMLPFLGGIAVLTAYLQAQEKFLMSAFINIPIIIIVILALILSEYIGIRGIAIANVLGAICQFIIIASYVLKKTNFQFQPTVDFKDKNLYEMLRLIIPIFIGTSVLQINLSVDKALASTFPEGTISALTYAQKINEMFFGLISVTIATFIFPKLSRYAANKDLEQITKIVRNSLFIVSILVLPVVLFVLSNNELIVKLLFERGNFSVSSTLNTSNALFYYSIGMLFFGMRDVLNKTFYSMSDTTTPMLNSIISIITNILLSILLINFLGFEGIALASSLAGVTTTILLIRSLKKKVPGFRISIFMVDQFKVLFSSFIFVITNFFLFKAFQNYVENQSEEILYLLLSVVLSSIVYIFILGLLNFKNLKYVLSEKDFKLLRKRWKNE